MAAQCFDCLQQSFSPLKPIELKVIYAILNILNWLSVLLS